MMATLALMGGMGVIALILAILVSSAKAADFAYEIGMLITVGILAYLFFLLMVGQSHG